MSNSIKKNWVYKDRNPFMKNYANRRIRQLPICIEYDEDDFCELDDKRYNYHLNNNLYKKHTCSYDICDWRNRSSPKEVALGYDALCTEHMKFSFWGKLKLKLTREEYTNERLRWYQRK